MDQHDQIQEINRVGCELVDIYIGPHHFDSPGPELFLLGCQTQRLCHALVTNTVRQQISIISDSFHENRRVNRE